MFEIDLETQYFRFLLLKFLQDLIQVPYIEPNINSSKLYSVIYS